MNPTRDVDTFRTVVENCPVPILIAGGPRLETDRDVLQMVVDAIKAGAAGLVFGRNVWQGGRPRGMLWALRVIVHDEVNVETACDILDRVRLKSGRIVDSPVAAPSTA